LDIVRDNLGDGRQTYPATLYAVAGTQAAQGHEKENELVVLKLSSLSRIEKEDDGSESDDESDEDEESEPILESKSIPLTSCTNRIRVQQRPRVDTSGFPTTFAASMMESGQVLIHDVTPHLNAFDTPGSTISPQQNQPFVINAHKSTEGFAVDWSPSGIDLATVGIILMIVGGVLFLLSLIILATRANRGEPLESGGIVEERRIYNDDPLP